MLGLKMNFFFWQSVLASFSYSGTGLSLQRTWGPDPSQERQTLEVQLRKTFGYALYSAEPYAGISCPLSILNVKYCCGSVACG